MAEDAKPGERIAKVLARAGVASRRGAEILIVEGRVKVNGRVIDSPALNIGPRDRVQVDGKPLPEMEPTKLWLYHKPLGLVTTERDEQGRPTVFQALPPELGRVLSVGRLDLNSEGLLLLTNDGALKRRLELPSTGWLRRYRARVNGTPTPAMLEPLRQGITLDGERFQPMEVSIDRQQGANAWLTVGIREGRNREIRRALDHVGLSVNRLIRISYGPFQLGTLKRGEVEQVKGKVLREQLGEDGPGPANKPAKPARSARGTVPSKPAGKPATKAPRLAGSKRPAPTAAKKNSRRTS
ncbi:pseudouridine synthase [Roseibaca sp. Y0-43]|uniref:pseudouridine synthase n=1 Tax=Roseibaca sp. Y0-43 TaxID=2816854 RepID=UPI001D0C3C14|nr:pseudouridine synthase [Roseibaca sp. Y0-43]MCC1480629.1 rRNA pseudouridine synthase [Roseibaca sp. Y0-43]